jgi:hypothetical protein
VRPPHGASTCPLCRAEALDHVSERDNGTSTEFREVDAEHPDEFPVKSPRARAILERRDADAAQRRRDETQMVEVLDSQRPTLIELDHARPGPERRLAYDRHMKALGVRRGRRRAGGDVTIEVPNLNAIAAAGRARALEVNDV